MHTKTMLAGAVALATVLTTAAFAQGLTPQQMMRPDPYSNWPHYSPGSGAFGSNAYAQEYRGHAPRRADRQHLRARAHAVYDYHGHIVGSDPDPRVRQEILNDPSESR